MKLLVEIPEAIYEEAVNNRNYITVSKIELVWKAIAKGQPLPEDCEILTKEAYEEYILNHLQELDHGEYAFKALEQEPKWIPVSEKLPDPFTFVNATCRSLVDDRENWVVETIYLPIPKETNKHGYSDWGNIPMLNWGEAEVIAWVERIIPQPYKADRSEEDGNDD